MTNAQIAIIQSTEMQALAIKAIAGMNVDAHIGNPNVIALANAVAVTAGLACSLAGEIAHLRNDDAGVEAIVTFDPEGGSRPYMVDLRDVDAAATVYEINCPTLEVAISRASSFVNGEA